LQFPGAPADLVIFKARSWTELFARPQSDRIVLRQGRQIDRTLPDYAELDDLMRTA
jgi:cytosine/creatinine deaminase